MNKVTFFTLAALLLAPLAGLLAAGNSAPASTRETWNVQVAAVGIKPDNQP